MKLGTVFVLLVLQMAVQAPIKDPVAEMALPAGRETWTVKVITSGGYAGKGHGNIAISSKGEIVCSGLARGCARTFNVGEVQRVIERILADKPAVPNPPPVPGACYDCLTRRLTISIRDSADAEHLYSFSWNELTVASVPPKILQLYDSMMTLRN
jgi:hypothetical protein